MPRPKKRRCCQKYQADRIYKPLAIPMSEIETVQISLDQFEAIRHCDIEGLKQEEAGLRMGISRGTVQRLLYTARKDIAEAILSNHAILINLKESETKNVSVHTNRGKCRAR